MEAAALAPGLVLDFGRLELERRRGEREADERAEPLRFLAVELEPLLRLLAPWARLEPPFWERVDLRGAEPELARSPLFVDAFFVCCGI